DEAWWKMDRLYRPLVYFWCRRRDVGQHREDIWAEVIRIVFQKIAEFHHDRPGDSFRGWLRGITHNVIRIHVRDGPQAIGGTDFGRRLQDVPDPSPQWDEEDPEE